MVRQPNAVKPGMEILSKIYSILVRQSSSSVRSDPLGLGQVVMALMY